MILYLVGFLSMIIIFIYIYFQHIYLLLLLVFTLIKKHLLLLNVKCMTTKMNVSIISKNSMNNSVMNSMLTTSN